MKKKGNIQKAIVLIVILILFVEYALGIFAQAIAPPVINIALEPIPQPISYNPIVAISKALSTTAGMIINFGILLTAVILILVKLFGKKGDGIEDPRGFIIAYSGEYGTAHFMTDKEREKALYTGDIKDTVGNILGYIGPDPSFIDMDLGPTSGFDYSKNADTPKEVINRNIVSIPLKTRLGPHVAVFGASGSGKSFCFSRNLMFQCADRGESMIVTDPKGELYNDAAVMLTRMGYTVKQFNLKEPIFSDSWNCLQECVTQGEDNVQLLVQQFTGIIMDNTTPPGGSGGGDSAFFDAAEGSLLTSLCLYSLLDTYGNLKNDPDVSLGDVYDILTDRAKLEESMNKLQAANPHHPALKSYGGYRSGSDNVRGNIVTGLANRLQVLQADVIHEIVGHTDIDLVLPARQKAAYFIIISDQEATLKFLASLFFTFMFVRIVNYADARPNQKCDVPVNMIMDEFPNIGIIPDFTKKISTVRSRDIRIMIIFQNLAQLEERYPNGQWQEILGNCDTQICLGVRDEKTAEYLSKKCGESTIIQKSTSESIGKYNPVNTQTRHNVSTNRGKRMLMTADEIQKLKSNKLVAFIAGQQPILLDKYGFIYHPDAEYITQCSFRDNRPMWLEGFYRSKAEIRDKVKNFQENSTTA